MLRLLCRRTKQEGPKPSTLLGTYGQFEGPFFPPVLDELRTQLDVYNLTTHQLREAGYKVWGHWEWRQGFRTADGYRWWWGITMFPKGGHGPLAVILPWGHDRHPERKDIFLPDRPIEVHARDCDEAAIEAGVRSLIKAVCWQQGYEAYVVAYRAQQWERYKREHGLE